MLNQASSKAITTNYSDLSDSEYGGNGNDVDNEDSGDYYVSSPDSSGAGNGSNNCSNSSNGSNDNGNDDGSCKSSMPNKQLPLSIATSATSTKSKKRKERQGRDNNFDTEFIMERMLVA